MKFKFLALTVVVLLGLGVGNTAWGQDYFYTCNDGAWNGTEVWRKTSDCTGAFVSAPNPEADNLRIIVNNNLTVSGDLSYSKNFLSFTVNGTLIVDGDLSFPNGSSNGITVGSSGLLIVKGSLTHGGNGGVQIASGGRLVVYDDANIQCAMTVDGQFNVSGDFKYSGNHTFTLNGDVIVGKDATFTNIGNVAFNTNSYIGILGNAVFSAQNNPTINGEIDVIGTVSGTKPPGSVTNNIETQAPVDPIMNVFYGMDVIAFLTGSDISTNTYTNSSGDAYSGVIWTSDNYQTFCYLNVILSGEIKFSNIASKGTAYFEYSVDGGYTWDTADKIPQYGTGNLYRKDDINAPSQMVRMRLVANGLPAGETVTISNITIAATNEGSEDVYPIEWPTIMPRDICNGEQAVYVILNPGVYDDIRWNYPPSSNVEIVSISPNKARCEVKWISSPGTLNVTVTGGSCGGASASITYPINVNKPTAFSASYSKTDISCSDTDPADGSITLSGCGGTGTYSYEWTEWPTANGFEIPDANRNHNQLTNLPEGTYKATVSDGIASPQNLEITIVRPAALSVSVSNAQAFLCAADAITGQFDISYSGGTWPYLIKIEKDGSEVATYDGTTPTATSGTLTWNPGGTLTYSGLGIGTYTVTLTGAVANGCPAATATITIVHDDEAPTFTDFPANVQMTMAEYQAAQASMAVAVPADQVGSIILNDGTSLFRDFTTTMGTLHNMSLKFHVGQSGATPDASDELLVEVSYEGGSWTTLQTYSGAISGDQTIALGMDADGKTNAQVRFTATIVTAGLTYTVSNVQISGSRFAVISPTCNDNSSVCSVSYIDSKPQWSSCSGYSNAAAEFHVVRTWTAVDACGNSTPRTQYLSVGTAPEFTGTFPGDETLDFCNNTPTIQSPMASDGCGDVTVSWEVRNSANEVVGNGVVTTLGDNVTLPALPADPAGNTDLEYTVTWTATDEAHMTLSQDQKITIKPAIAATITAPNLDNVCKDENVVFTVTPRGGTGTFNDTSFTPAGGTWNGTTYIFTTSLANVQEDETVTVRIQDVAIAGVDGVCNQDVLSPEFDVHDLIPTGGISRE